ncbi:uncharacterized protein N7469_000040 [Penicillium citrinum]|uniref:aldehyde dehydrogenase (NAD(+)) n=1 Tax=Penicillium citrinum TaxID=5077 RepID=A0A9W9PC88_PENCI|nr:uncharacterized protein N7469_000040 [Penicillium citrinum]KAJ5241713.1 hypothetical protein N7469_000040 [Penicillium citrinum]
MDCSDSSFETFFNVVNGECRGAVNFKNGIDLSTGEKLWDWSVTSTKDLEEAVQFANNVFKLWSRNPIEERAENIRRWKESYKWYIENFTTLLIAECGKTRALAAGEANEVISLFDHHLQLRIPEERIEDDHRIITPRYVPVGVVAAICPWNFPIILAMGKILAAVLSGCCIIVKPSPFTPYSALKLVELAQPFFPPGVIQVLSGDDYLGPALVSHPDIHKISFTRSGATGKKIMQCAVATMKRVTLELGGNDPAIVFPNVDIEKTASKVVQGCLVFSGRACVAIKRVYVDEDIYQPFLNAMVKAASMIEVGKATDNSTTMGPMQNQMQRQRAQELVADAEVNGYTFALPSRSLKNQSGYLLSPAIVDNPPPEQSRIVVEEQFGPIIPVLKWSNEADVISRANDTKSGLGASIWNSDVAHAERIGRQIQSGSVFINSWAKKTPRGMLSGHKESGI